MLTSEYTTPLEGKPDYRSVGIIQVYDNKDYKYNIGEIIYERFDDQNFQYIFKPYWDLIECLPVNLFFGIPGINMEIKKDAYYRVNMTPVFISMRSPSENREDVKELMDEVGLNYYDRFEWLLRTTKRCGDDNLIVVRKNETPLKVEQITKVSELNLSVDDEIILENLSDLKFENSMIIVDMFRLLQSGAKIYISKEDRFLEMTERKIMLYLLGNMRKRYEENNKKRKSIGIEKAKLAGKYKGRKPIEIEEDFLEEIAIDFLNGKVTEKEAMKRLDLTSRATFYRKIKKYRNN